MKLEIEWTEDGYPCSIADGPDNTYEEVRAQLFVAFHGPKEKAAPTAVLFAAAPDLLDACQVALDFMTLSLGYDDTDFQVRNLRAAIAKARGGK